MQYSLKIIPLTVGSLLIFGGTLITPISANGNPPKLGVIETSEEPPNEPRKGSHIGINGDLDGRLEEEFDFGGKMPGFLDIIAPLPPNTPANTHSTTVAKIAAQQNSADIFFGGLGTTGTGTEPIYNAFRASTDWLYRNKGVGLFNLSDWIEGDPPPNQKASSAINRNGNGDAAKFIDWFSQTRDVLLIKSAGNNGSATGSARNQISNPGDAYNVITVGSARNNTRNSNSSYWLEGDNDTQPDRRGKPDILAEGRATSYAAPLVAAAAAKLWDKSLALGAIGSYNHLAQKAIILNSAEKRLINQPQNQNARSSDRNMEPSDRDYLDPNAALTLNWTPTQWNTNGQTLSVTKPLDDEQGTGVLSLERVITQFDGGEQGPGTVTPIGWDRELFPAGSNPLSYILNFSIAPQTFITTTLTWDRMISCTLLSTVCTNDSVSVDDRYSFAPQSFPNFDLLIYFKEQLVAESISSDENVEHLHYRTETLGNPGDYSIRVMLNGNTSATPYGLAWWTCSNTQQQQRSSSAERLGSEQFCQLCQPCRVRTPEPSSIFGFLVLGTLGAASALNRKQNQPTSIDLGKKSRDRE